MQIKADNVTLVDVNSLIPHPKNCHDHPPEQLERLCKLIEYQGFRNPIVVQKGTNLIVCGHGRTMAAKILGMTQVPVLYQEFESDAQLYAYLVSDNAIGKDTWATLDLGKVNLELENMPDLDLDLLGLKDFEAIAIEELDPQTDEDEVPEVVDPITKRGDIWLLGNHRVMCGDSTMIDDVERLMAGEKAELVMTDPPYRIETKGGCKGELGDSLRKQGSSIEFISDFIPSDFLAVMPILFEKNKFNAYVFCNKELLPDYLSWARDNKISFNVLVWKKPNAIPIGDSHRPDIEYILLFRKNATWNNGLKDVNYSRCLEYGRERGLHPTMKPVELLENEIKISSTKGGNVADLFNGSGSTLMACENTSRKYFGIEMMGQYCDVTIQRWQNYTGKEATLESTGETYNSLKANQDGAA
jgi:DNA modification methylase